MQNLRHDHFCHAMKFDRYFVKYVLGINSYISAGAYLWE